jgi:predicted component of type VI protein secretion system
MRLRSPLAALSAEPRRFRFDAAVRVLTRARGTDDPATAVRFHAPAGLVYPAALGFAINPVLASREVPPLWLNATADPPPRLGWNTWIPGPAGGFTARPDAADAIFEAEVIEAQQIAKESMQ